MRIVALALLMLPAVVMADGAIAPGSAKDGWLAATSEDHGKPIIHSFRVAALELTDQGRFRWRAGISWHFRHALPNGMPGPEDREPMKNIDDAIHEELERDDESRIVYFTTGGGVREVMLYTSDPKNIATRIDVLFKRFPEQFPGNRAQWSYVKSDASWSGYRALQKAFHR